MLQILNYLVNQYYCIILTDDTVLFFLLCPHLIEANRRNRDTFFNKTFSFLFSLHCLTSYCMPCLSVLEAIVSNYFKSQAYCTVRNFTKLFDDI